MNIWLALLAVLPGLVLIYLVYRKDRIEKEPLNILIKLVILGAISAIVASVCEVVFTAILDRIVALDTLLYIVFEMIVIVGFSEEYCKYKVTKLMTWNNPEFDFEFDAIVYCVCSAGGFAILENIMYVVDGGLKTALMRAYTAVPMHIVLGIIMGIFYGKAKKYNRKSKTVYKLFLFTAVFAPMIIHGIYDFIVSIEISFIYFLGYIALIYLIAFLSLDSSAYRDLPFVKSAVEKELDEIIRRLDANMSNNYKDNAQENLRELEAKYKELYEFNKLSAKQEIYYEETILDRKEKMIGFTHKDQKPYWT